MIRCIVSGICGVDRMQIICCDFLSNIDEIDKKKQFEFIGDTINILTSSPK